MANRERGGEGASSSGGMVVVWSMMGTMVPDLGVLLVAGGLGTGSERDTKMAKRRESFWHRGEGVLGGPFMLSSSSQGGGEIGNLNACIIQRLRILAVTILWVKYG